MGLDDAGVERVHRWIANGKYRKAQREMERHLAGDPDDVRAIALLVSARVGANESAEALAIAEDAVRRFPDAAPAYAALGYVHLIRYEIDDARRALERALELDPRHAGAAQNLAVVHTQRKDGAEAERVVLEALERRPNHGDLLGVLADIRWQRDDRSGAREARARQLRVTRSPIVLKQIVWSWRFWTWPRSWLVVFGVAGVALSFAGVFVPVLQDAADVLITVGFAALFALVALLLAAEVEEYVRRRTDFSLSETIVFAGVLVLLPLFRFTDFPWFGGSDVPPPPVEEQLVRPVED